MIIETAEFDIECPNCKQRSGIEFDQGSCCQNFQYIFNRRKQKFDWKVLTQISNFFKRLPSVNKKILEILFLWWEYKVWNKKGDDFKVTNIEREIKIEISSGF